VIIDERTNSKQLYVAMTRGRNANHVHTAPPTFDLEQHGPTDTAEQWTPRDAVTRALRRHPDQSSALARRRQLRQDAHERSEQHRSPAVALPSDCAGEAMQRLQRLSRRPAQGLGR
jgi:hypothetical protein